MELGASANPPGFDAQLLGLEVGATKSFTIHYPPDHPIGELANTDVSYTVTVKAIKRRVLPELDDEFAKDLGEFETLDALTSRVRHDLEHEAGHAAERDVRADLMKQLAARVSFEVPPSLIEREIDRRLEDFAGRLVDQGIDPRQAGSTGKRFATRNAIRRAKRSRARWCSTRSHDVSSWRSTDAEVEQEIERYAERTGPNACGSARRARERRRIVAYLYGAAQGEVD